MQGYVQAYIEQRLTKQNRRKLTRDQWLASAESLGLTMARNGMTDAQIEQAAYEIWMKYRPNRKESLNRQGKKYIPFKMEDFFRAIENGANSRQEFSSRYSKPAEPAKIPEFNDPDVLDIPFGTIEYDGKTMDFYDYAQAKPNLSQTNAILSFVRIARKQDAELKSKRKKGSLDIKTGLLANGELTGAQEPSSVLNIPTSAIGTLLSKSGFTQSFTEHGVIIGLANVRADLNYQQGMRLS